MSAARPTDQFPGPLLRNHGSALAVGLVFVILATRLFLLCDRYSVNIFSADQWVFEDATAFEHHSEFQMFGWQHGPHRQGLGAVVESVTGPLTNWNSRFQGFLVVAIICAACLLALWLKRRLFSQLTYADAVIPLIFLTPLHYQVFLENVNLSHGPLPLMLITIYCLTLTIASHRWRLSAVLAVNMLLIFTGFGLLVGPLTPILLLFEWRRTKNRSYLVAAVLGILCFASFFIGYKYLPAATCFLPRPVNPLRYGLFAGLMFAGFVGADIQQNVPIAIMTAGVLIILICYSWGRMVGRVKASGSVKDLIVVFLLSYALLFAFTTAYGRVCISFAQAQEPRYLTYLVLGYFGLYLGALSAKLRFERRLLICGVLIIAICGQRLSQQYLAEMESTRQHKQQWKDCYLQGHNMIECDARTGYGIFWDPEPPDLQRKLDLLQQKHWNLFSK